MCAFPRNCLESRSHQVTPQHTGRFLSAIVPTVRPSSCRLALEQFESVYVRINAPIVHFFVWRWTQLGVESASPFVRGWALAQGRPPPGEPSRFNFNRPKRKTHTCPYVPSDCILIHLALDADIIFDLHCR